MSIRVRAAVIVTLLLPVASFAAQRTFVSAGSGSDSNACTRQFPCRNFAAAILVTDPEGEVVALDSGGYGGTVLISQSVALIAPAGVHAAITTSSTTAIYITTPSGGPDVVVIRGLYLSGLGFQSGILFQSGGTLHLENCVVHHFNTGVEIDAVGADVYIKDSVSRENTFYGFTFYSTGLRVRASLDSIVATENGSYGLFAASGSEVTVTRGLAAGNGNTGFYSSGGVLNLESCTAAHNVTGVLAEGTGTARVAASMITGNVTGVSNAASGSTISFGNNDVDGNATNGSFTSMIGPQ